MDQLLRATAVAERRHFWFRGFRWFVGPLVREATAGVQGARILDCGCGTGANLELLSKYGVAAGFDLSATGLAFGRNAGRQQLVRASVAAVPFRSGLFDLATSFDVLYALDAADERAAVTEMFRVLKPGGFALVNVAAMEVLRGDHSVLSHERRRYSRRSLGALMTGAGFEVVRLTYTNQVLFLPMLAVRLMQRVRGLAPETEAQQEITVPPGPVNAWLTGLLWLESLWLRVGNNAAGSSLLCLARKPGRSGSRTP